LISFPTANILAERGQKVSGAKKRKNYQVSGSFMPGIFRMPRPGEQGHNSKAKIISSCESAFKKALDKTGFRKIDDSGEELKRNFFEI